MRHDLPSGTVTFLFSDVEGSTELLHELGAESYAAALAKHRRVIRESCAAHGGVEVDTQGDAFFVAFPTAPGAVAAATEALGGLASGPIRVRIGIHTGTPHVGDEGYVGVDVHRAARIAACGHGGQVLVSSSAASLLGAEALRDLGEHRLKGLPTPERIYQFGDADFPPLESLGQTDPPKPSSFLGLPDAGRAAEVLVRGPAHSAVESFPLSGNRVIVGRLPGVNDIALQPDPQFLVTRAAHCSFEREGSRWFIVDGGSVNGTLLRRGNALERVAERTALRDGDVICVLASLSDTDERRFFEMAFQAGGDSQATRTAPIPRATVSAAPASACLSYDVHESRLVLVRGTEQQEIRIRPQAHRLVRYMVERNAAAGDAPALCTQDELLQAVWAHEPMRTRAELARLVLELRIQLEPFDAGHLVESEGRRGYRLRTCPTGAEDV